MTICLRFHPETPSGWSVWKKNVEVAGVPFRIADARKFIYGRSQNLRLEIDPGNARDPNAIKIIGNYKHWFLNRCAHIGFVPALEAHKIIERNVAEFMPCLRNIWIGDQTSLAIRIRFDVLKIKRTPSSRSLDLEDQQDQRAKGIARAEGEDTLAEDNFMAAEEL